jgi:hypothetical protein
MLPTAVIRFVREDFISPSDIFNIQLASHPRGSQLTLISRAWLDNLNHCMNQDGFSSVEYTQVTCHRPAPMCGELVPYAGSTGAKWPNCKQVRENQSIHRIEYVSSRASMNSSRLCVLVLATKRPPVSNTVAANTVDMNTACMLLLKYSDSRAFRIR